LKTGTTIEAQMKLDYPKASIINEKQLVDGLLVDMDLTTELLNTAIMRGHAARMNATESHPVGTGGNFAYIETNGALREELIALGWTPVNSSNIPLIRHPSGAFQIFASSGDEHTGSCLDTLRPSTLREKGFKVSSLFESNHRDLFDKTPPSDLNITDKRVGICLTWILLYHFDEMTQQTKAEFALPQPVVQSDNKTKHQVSHWEKRIILDVYGGGLPTTTKRMSTPEFTGETDFDISSKTKIL
jgi:hypothetical protein